MDWSTKWDTLKSGSFMDKEYQIDLKNAAIHRKNIVNHDQFCSIPSYQNNEYINYDDYSGKDISSLFETYSQQLKNGHLLKYNKLLKKDAVDNFDLDGQLWDSYDWYTTFIEPGYQGHAISPVLSSMYHTLSSFCAQTGMTSSSIDFFDLPAAPTLTKYSSIMPVYYHTYDLYKKAYIQAYTPLFYEYIINISKNQHIYNKKIKTVNVSNVNDADIDNIIASASWTSTTGNIANNNFCVIDSTKSYNNDGTVNFWCSLQYADSIVLGNPYAYYPAEKYFFKSTSSVFDAKFYYMENISANVPPHYSTVYYLHKYIDATNVKSGDILPNISNINATFCDYKANHDLVWNPQFGYYQQGITYYSKDAFFNNINQNFVDYI